MPTASENRHNPLFPLSERNLSIVIFTLFSTWFISFPYEGTILYALAQRFSLDVQPMILGVIIVHMIGLFSCGLYIKNIRAAKRLMLFTNILFVLGSCVFFFVPSVLWYLALFAISFFSGSWIASWGFYLKKSSPKRQRVKTVSFVLIVSAVLMIFINVLTTHISAYLGLGIDVLFLISTAALSFRLPDPQEKAPPPANKSIKMSSNLKKVFVFLCLFIVGITINSGLMFQVVNPAFAEIQWFTSWYWAVPYILAILVLRNNLHKLNRSYVLYTAIAMMGLSFIAFIALDRSVTSYLIVNTLLLSACGIYDLFWWSLLGELLELKENPVVIFGTGLAANVFGVLLGELIALCVPADQIFLIALTIVCITFVMLPPLHLYLNKYIFSVLFSETLHRQSDRGANIPLIENLTERENQIVACLLKGLTYKMIADELYLSENTVKTHIKNIYSKLEVKNKSELIRKVSE
ncbi:MAG: LuxR C-terminal-related transcriptional regulator [Anaerofustis sp.]